MTNAVTQEAGGPELVARILGPDRKTVAPAILSSPSRRA
jgi:hypothetical protein